MSSSPISPEVRFKIPVLTPPPTLRLSRPTVGTEYANNSNPNGQCLCWDAIIPTLFLLGKAEDLTTEICRYHHQYLTRRIHLSKTHDCDCHYQPDPQRCLACGYCHLCGCDVTTTSTPQFHRCSCAHCLARCCPHDPTLAEVKATHLRHHVRRTRQADLRCLPTDPPHMPRREEDHFSAPHFRITQRELQEARRLFHLAPQNDYWPTYPTNSPNPVLVVENRSLSGLDIPATPATDDEGATPGSTSSVAPLSSAASQEPGWTRQTALDQQSPFIPPASVNVQDPQEDW